MTPFARPEPAFGAAFEAAAVPARPRLPAMSHSRRVRPSHSRFGEPWVRRTAPPGGAKNAAHHDRAHASRVVVPVPPR
jgi:hypothetical protein